jgi:hypothetical protein
MSAFFYYETRLTEFIQEWKRETESPIEMVLTLPRELNHYYIWQSHMPYPCVIFTRAETLACWVSAFPNKSIQVLQQTRKTKQRSLLAECIEDAADVYLVITSKVQANVDRLNRIFTKPVGCIVYDDLASYMDSPDGTVTELGIKMECWYLSSSRYFLVIHKIGEVAMPFREHFVLEEVDIRESDVDNLLRTCSAEVALKKLNEWVTSLEEVRDNNSFYPPNIEDMLTHLITCQLKYASITDDLLERIYHVYNRRTKRLDKARYLPAVLPVAVLTLEEKQEEENEKKKDGDYVAPREDDVADKIREVIMLDDSDSDQEKKKPKKPRKKRTKKEPIPLFTPLFNNVAPPASVVATPEAPKTPPLPHRVVPTQPPPPPQRPATRPAAASPSTAGQSTAGQTTTTTPIHPPIPPKLKKAIDTIFTSTFHSLPKPAISASRKFTMGMSFEDYLRANRPSLLDEPSQQSPSNPFFLQDCYSILEVSKTATLEEIRFSFRSKVLKLHPDKSSGNTTQAYDRVMNAYKILSDEKQRREYDAYRNA